MGYYSTEVTGKNPKESVEGSNSLIKELISAIMEADKIGILTNVKLELRIKEYTDEIADYEAKEIDGRDIIIDKSSLETLSKFLNNEPVLNNNLKQLWDLLIDYSTGDHHKWYFKDKFSDFLKEFTRLYQAEYVPGCTKHIIREDDEQDYYDYYEVNEILKEMSLPFRIRRANNNLIVDRIDD